MSMYATWVVEPVPDGWIVHGDGRSGDERRLREKPAAIRVAKRLAKRNPPSQVVVRAPDGTDEEVVRYNGAAQATSREGTGAAEAVTANT